MFEVLIPDGTSGLEQIPSDNPVLFSLTHAASEGSSAPVVSGRPPHGDASGVGLEMDSFDKFVPLSWPWLRRDLTLESTL